MLRDLPTTGKYSRSLLLGTAFACNIGGTLTPIASPQNVVSLGALQSQGYDLAFGIWVLVAIPFGTLACTAAWAILVIDLSTAVPHSLPRSISFTQNPTLSKKQKACLVILCIAAVVLWSTFSVSNNVFGDLGIVALIIMVAAFGVGFLTQSDFNSFSWHLLVLIGGGNVLGLAVRSSGLLPLIVNTCAPFLSLHPWIAMLELVCMMLLVTTFVSHTVAALILIPFVVQMGELFGKPELAVLCCCLACSCAMALPMSSLPNSAALMAEDDLGRPYLHAVDFLRVGLPVSVACALILVTFGYAVANTII